MSAHPSPYQAPANTSSESTPKTSGLAIAALVLAFLIPPVGSLLGIFALLRIRNSRGALKGRVLAILALVPTAILFLAPTISIPNFLRYQLRSKQSEAKTMLQAVQARQEAMRAEIDAYVPAPPTPTAEGLGSVKQPWVASPCPATCGGDAPASCEGFECLGLQPEGAVFFSYACTTTEVGEPGFTCGALGDLDGDGNPSLFVLGTPGPNGGLAAPVPDFGGLAPACPGARPGEVYECTSGQY